LIGELDSNRWRIERYSGVGWNREFWLRIRKLGFLLEKGGQIKNLGALLPYHDPERKT
jgi:hypothetical protein